MQTSRQIIRAALDTTIGDTVPADRMIDLERALCAAFDWHPIDHADEFGMKHVPAGKKWGPRLVALVKDTNDRPVPMVVYWDPDDFWANPVPAPYWRVLGLSPDWSRRHQPTHFLRPYAAHTGG